MKILICGINFAPELTGIGKYTSEFTKFLFDQGVQVKVIAGVPYYPSWQKTIKYSGWRYHRENWEGIEVFHCPIYVPKNPTGFKRLLHLITYAASIIPVLLMQAKWKPDLMFSVAPTIVSAPVVLFFSKILQSKSWIHIQDFELAASRALNILPVQENVFRLASGIEERIFRQFDICSTISNQMIKSLLSMKLPRSRIKFFPNWVDLDEIFPISSSISLRKQIGLSENQIVILYAGNFGKKQNLQLVIEAAKILDSKQNLVFLLCGEGSTKSELHTQADGMSNIKFLEPQPYSKLNELLNLADIHVLPQQTVTSGWMMPSKLTGMLASGKVSVVTANPTSEIAEELEGIVRFCPTDNPNALADEIQHLSLDKESRKRYGSKGRSYAVKHWSKEKILNRILVDFRQLVE